MTGGVVLGVFTMLAALVFVIAARALVLAVLDTADEFGETED